MLFVVLVMLMFVVNLCPKADQPHQPHQEDRCWSQCLLTEQWCLLAHLHYKVDLYHLIIHRVNTIVLVAMCRRCQNCVFNGLGAGL